MDKVYNIPRYDTLVERTLEKIKELGVVKGGEYAGDVDRLANFRRNAAAAGVTMEQCWQIYSGKHWDAIIQYIRDDAVGKERTRAEPLEGRVDDLIVYLLLFKAMLDERRAQPADERRAQPADGGKSVGGLDAAKAEAAR